MMCDISFRHIKRNRQIRIIDFAIISLFILFIAAACPILGKDIFIIAVFLFLVIIFVIRKRKVDPLILFILFLWCIINLVSSYNNNDQSINIFSFFSSAIKILIPYFMIKDVGGAFFDKFFHYAYTLVLLSLPIFVLELLFPFIFSKVAPIFSFMTGSEQAASGGFYSFIFMHSGWSDGRNCGFMWEAGGYACVLIFMLFYHWLKNEYRFDKTSLVIIIALITTFSTAGYLALFFALIAFTVSNKVLKKHYALSALVVIIITAIVFDVYNNAPFMKSKINDYIEKGTDTYEWSFNDQHLTRVSRYGIALIALDNSLLHPLGDGIYYSNYILHKYGSVSGPSSLADILSQWGWIGIFFLIAATFKFPRLFCGNIFFSVSFVISMFIVWFSNPFIIKYLIYAIAFYPFVFRKITSNLIHSSIMHTYQEVE